ncbi:MAG: ABC transporter ATP-binding protein [Bdellovibrionota bacterium]
MIALENVRLRFDSRGIAGLSDVSLKLPEGTITALMGPNGSGKTTLLRILSGEIKPDSGRITADAPALFVTSPEVSSETNVQKYLISRVHEEIHDEKKIQLTRDLADIFEFTFQLRQKMGELSAGQKQKVFLAGELIRNPKLILLDEPFTHLDPHTRKDILKALFTYVRRQNLTLLWVTHDMNEASRFSDRIVLIQHGKIEQEGTPTELMTKPKNIFTAQFVGYHNFFPVKKSGSFWETPWGKEKFSHEPDSAEAIMVVPDTALEIDPRSDFRVKVEEAFYRDTLWTIMATHHERTITFQTLKELPDSGQLLGLTPRPESCFLIAL